MNPGIIIIGGIALYLLSRPSQAAVQIGPLTPYNDYNSMFQNPMVSAGDIAAYQLLQAQGADNWDSAMMGDKSAYGLPVDDVSKTYEVTDDGIVKEPLDNWDLMGDTSRIEESGMNESNFQPTATGQNLRLSMNGAQMIMSHEGVGPGSVAGSFHVPYVDVVGKRTIGYGHLIRPGENFTRITEMEAQAIFAEDVRAAESYVSSVVRAPLTQNQFDALVSLAFNVGSFGAGLIALLNAQDYIGAANKILEYNKGTVAGKLVTIDGLTNRRQSERSMFLSSTMV